MEEVTFVFVKGSRRDDPLALPIPSAMKYSSVLPHHWPQMPKQMLPVWLLNEQVSTGAQGANKGSDELAILRRREVAKTARPIQYPLELIFRVQPAQIQRAEGPVQPCGPQSQAHPAN